MKGKARPPLPVTKVIDNIIIFILQEYTELMEYEYT